MVEKLRVRALVDVRQMDGGAKWMNSAPGGPSQWNERLALVVVRLLLVEPDGTHRAGWGILGIAQLPCSGFSALSVHSKSELTENFGSPRG